MNAVNRRNFVIVSGLATSGIIAATTPLARAAEDEDEAGVTAPEDLMREHGVLNRVLLIYEECLRRLPSDGELVSGAFRDASSIVRAFIEDYHGMMEEKYLFPEFEKKNRLVELVRTLKEQHKAGRSLTDLIMKNSAADQFRKQDRQRELEKAAREFVRMYRPHEAREDTVLFPALRSVTSPARVAEMGEQFEEIEHKMLGEEGFEKTVDKVAAIEKTLGINDLSQFTPER